MKEQLISFETAVLAREKGFREFSADFDYMNRYKNSSQVDKWLPTQSFLQKWLRDIHGIHVNCIFSNRIDIRGYFYGVIESKDAENNHVYTHYEDALEAGLVEALKLIK